MLAGADSCQADRHSPDPTAEDRSVTAPQANQIGLWCKQAASSCGCPQQVVRFSTLATAMQVVTYLVWQKGSLLTPLAQWDLQSNALSMQSTPCRCTCSQLEHAEADLVAYKNRLAARLAGAAGQWESAGYLGASGE
jgi:hypothetical protein